MALRTDSKDKDEPGDERPRPSWTRMAKRYGPFVAVVVVVGIAVALFGTSGGDDDGGGGAGSEATSIDNDELIRSGPMTWQKAEAEGKTDDIDWGPNCDTERGTITLPVVGAPPCVEPFSGDNGGATSSGVTADEVKIIYYQPDPTTDPAGAALLSATGADLDPDSAYEVVKDYADLYNSVFETYGRHVTVERFLATGPGTDAAVARADAIAIAERHPFAVVNGPTQTGAIFGAELASRGIVCGVDCAGAMPQDQVMDYYPYIYEIGETPDQAVSLAAELFGKLAGPGPAELAGDPAMRRHDRVYAVVHYDTPDGDHEPVFQSFKSQLADHGIDLATDVRFELDTSRMQENARTIISRLKSAGVTTVIFYGDPLTPAALTQEATVQDYHPEWLLGPNVLEDTTILARQNDGEQWKHGFGLSFVPARGERSTQSAWHVYEWAFGHEPVNNTVGVIDPRLRSVFTGIHLAGPNLTPETFRDGVFRNPVAGGGPTVPQVSVGDHGVWPDIDMGGIDDATIIWWDPEAQGEDETGRQGQGMYRYAKGGERYTLGHFPDSQEEAGLFDVDQSELIYDHLPDEDVPPDYPAPDLSGG
jgi:hypothetical protein